MVLVLHGLDDQPIRPPNIYAAESVDAVPYFAILIKKDNKKYSKKFKNKLTSYKKDNPVSISIHQFQHSLFPFSHDYKSFRRDCGY